MAALLRMLRRKEKPSSGNIDLGSDKKKKDKNINFTVGSASWPNEPKVEVIMAGDYRGWNTTTNRLLALTLATDERLRFRGFVPKRIGRREQLTSHIDLIEDENIPGDSPIELLDFPADRLNMDFLIMHSFTPELENQAETICRAKKCKWIHLVHTVRGELVKFFEEAGIPTQRDHEAEHQRQVELCKKADVVLTIGPKVAEAYKSALRSCGKDTNVVSLIPPIFELDGVRRIHENQGKFYVLIDALDPSFYFNMKGCDIAIKAIAILQDMSYHLIFAVRPGSATEELEEYTLEQGIHRNRFTLKLFSDNTDSWARCFARTDIDVVIMPSRIEGFGLSALYAISAKIPVLVSRHAGLAMALKTLPSGASHVVESDDPHIWADRIREVKGKDAEILASEAEQLRSEYKSEFNWKDQCSKLVEKMITKHVPAEILARGPLAVRAYNKALEQGATRVMRVPIMLIGHERSGKTSLKKSLRGQQFNRKEESTDGIERDPSYFSVSTEIWSTGEKSQQPDNESTLSLPNKIAQFMVADLMGEENHEVVELSDAQALGNDTESAESQYLESNVDTNAPPAEVNTDSNEQNQEQAERSLAGSLLPEFSENESKKEPAEQKVPSTTAACVERLLQQSEREDEDKVYSVLWDFGGQLVYYVTHPLFLTPNAVYLLVYNLTRNPQDRAPPIVRQGIFEQKIERFCRKTNEDYLHFWMSSVSSLVSQNKSHSQTEGDDPGNQPKRLPPVILVCTHADECKRASELARKIYGSLSDKAKPYRDHLLKKFFIVDNTKSGSADECPEVKRLREEILAVVRQLPQVKQIIPIKWLRFEEALKLKSENGEPFITIDDAKQIANEECKITDDQQFNTLMNFLHDQRILIHFDDTPELGQMVILDLQWLIDLFKRVITVKPYDPTADDEQYEELWKKLENEGILEDELLQIVWRPLLKTETKETTIESLLGIMEKFSLLCHWPSEEKSKQYLVPSMLRSHPDDNANKLLASAVLPSLFIRFKQLRSSDSSHCTSEVTSGEECLYVQVPLGLFPRLVVKFVQCTKENFRPSSMYKDMYQNFARFPIHSSECYSVILLCHSSSIEIVVHRDPDTKSDNSVVSTGRGLRSQLESMLQRMCEEFFWLKSMEYEFCVLCPVCCKQCSVNYCRRHDKNGCDKEECLHFWSESDLQKKQFCTGDAFSERTRVPVKEFVPWFQFPCMEQDIDKLLLSCGDFIVKEAVVMNIHIMDKLACLLDQPIRHGNQDLPTTKYWLHLAEEFKMSDEIRIRCQLNPENSPSKNMFEFQEARDPHFKVQMLKDGLQSIKRNDLVKKLEKCSLPDSATIRDLRVNHAVAFETICLQLDYHKNWQALGRKIGVPYDTLQQICTSTSCTNTVLDIIEKRKPSLTVTEMQSVLREMQREDVSILMDKLPEESTIATLRDNLECLEAVTTLLDKETPGSKNWLHFAQKFGISKEKCDYLKPKGIPSPTKQLMEYIVQVNPDLTLRQFIQTLMNLQRHDVVNALLKQFFSGPQTAAEEGFDERIIENVTGGVQDLSIENKQDLHK